MVQEGTFEEYQRWLNVRRQQKTDEKNWAMGAKGWKDYQRSRYANGVKAAKRNHWSWLDDHLAHSFPLPWLPLEWMEQEEEEDIVQAIHMNSLDQMDDYL